MIKRVFAAFIALLLVSCGQDRPSTAVADHDSIDLGEAVFAGSFEGRSDHITTGAVTIRKSDGAYYVVLENSFSLDGAPDPKLGFGANGAIAVETIFSPLEAKSGYQVYRLPASIDPAAYSELYVWCEQFSVPLGVATIG